jgi:hypothetical protein
VHNIIGGTDHALGLAILWGCVGTRYLKLDTIREDDSVGGGVTKLMAIVALDTTDGTTRLNGHIGKKVRQGGECVKLMAQWKCP